MMVQYDGPRLERKIAPDELSQAIVQLARLVRHVPGVEATYGEKRAPSVHYVSRWREWERGVGKMALRVEATCEIDEPGGR
jgi:hypothetical protein